MSAVRILVDVHERQSRIGDVLVEELGAEVEFVPLPAGDYFVGADSLVERKRVLDLHGAVIKGRLWPQLAKLRAAAAFPYLLVEGTDLDRGPLGGAAIPPISSSSARALLERFGSVAAVVAAGPEQWREVPGIGPDRARALEQTLGRVRG